MEKFLKKIKEKFILDRLTVCQLIILFFVAINIVGVISQSPGFDFYNYWIGVLSIRENPEINFYNKDQSVRQREQFYIWSAEEGSSKQQHAAYAWQMVAKKIEKIQPEEKFHFFLSTPVLYGFFGFFITGNYDFDYQLYSYIQFILFIFSIIVITKYLNFSFHEQLFALILFLACYSPFKSNLRVGNVAVLQLASLALVFIIIYKNKLKVSLLLCYGILLSCIVLFKPNLFFIPCFLFTGWLSTKQFRKLLIISSGMLIGGIGALLISSFIFGSIYTWFYWFQSATSISPAIGDVNSGNFSIARVIQEGFVVNNPSFIILAIITPLTLSFIAIFNLKNKNTGDEKFLVSMDVFLMNLGILLWLLSGPLVWTHYYLLAVPAILVLAQPMQTIPKPKKIFIYISVSIAFIFLSLSCRIGMLGITALPLAIMANIGIALLLVCSIFLYVNNVRVKS